MFFYAFSATVRCASSTRAMRFVPPSNGRVTAATAAYLVAGRALLLPADAFAGSLPAAITDFSLYLFYHTVHWNPPLSCLYQHSTAYVLELGWRVGFCSRRWYRRYQIFRLFLPVWVEQH